MNEKTNEPAETNVDSQEAFDITIPRSRYMDLLRSEAKLESLMCYGVDNWEGWDDAMAVYNDKLKEL